MPVIREHEELTDLDEDELGDLKDFAFENRTDEDGNYRPVLEEKNNRLYAQNYVGIIETRKGTVLEILPKVDFAKDEDTEKQIFFKMLRDWRGFKSLAQFNASHINAVRRFNMLEVFVHLFLNNLVLLTQRGLARHYQPMEDNQPCLRGRILFPQHIRENVANRARFYVGYDEFSANRPANRLIHSTIHKLRVLCGSRETNSYSISCGSAFPIFRSHRTLKAIGFNIGIEWIAPCSITMRLCNGSSYFCLVTVWLRLQANMSTIHCCFRCGKCLRTLLRRAFDGISGDFRARAGAAKVFGYGRSRQ